MGSLLKSHRPGLGRAGKAYVNFTTPRQKLRLDLLTIMYHICSDRFSTGNSSLAFELLFTVSCLVKYRENFYQFYAMYHVIAFLGL
jgi:hypothetical protein